MLLRQAMFELLGCVWMQTGFQLENQQDVSIYGPAQAGQHTETPLSVLTNGTEEEDEEEYEYGRSLLENTLVTLHSIHQKVLMSSIG